MLEWDVKKDDKPNYGWVVSVRVGRLHVGNIRLRCMMKRMCVQVHEVLSAVITGGVGSGFPILVVWE